MKKCVAWIVVVYALTLLIFALSHLSGCVVKPKRQLPYELEREIFCLEEKEWGRSCEEF